MLSIERARELLGDESLSDEQVTEIRDVVRILADLAITQFREENRLRNS